MTPQLNGLLIIDKPAGWTSHDIVGWVRRWAKQKKVGHAGTLDPAATGVLPLALNDGTRILEFLSQSSKAYLADITFGVSTDSADGDGVVLDLSSARPDLAQIELALQAFLGVVEQVPPQLSAIKIDGRRAYDLARSGVEVEMPRRSVTISGMEVCDWDGTTLQLHIDCSKGTYIRSIARDLGQALGIPAYLSNLVRTRSGPFTLHDSWTLPELRELDPVNEWETIAEHPDLAIAEWPAIVMTEAQSIDWSYGRNLEVAHESDERRARVYDSVGNWRGIAKRDAGTVWSPSRVIQAP